LIEVLRYSREVNIGLRDFWYLIKITKSALGAVGNTFSNRAIIGGTCWTSTLLELPASTSSKMVCNN